MFKKKITKESLAQLAEKMPVLSELEQRSMIGGIRFYDMSGMFICQNNNHPSHIDTEEMRFIDNGGLPVHDYIANAFGSMPNAHTQGHTWGGLSPEQRMTITRQFISDNQYAHLSNANIIANTDPNNTDQLNVNKTNGTHTLTIGSNSDLAFSTHTNFLLSLLHEEVHISRGYYESGVSGTTGVFVYASEYVAYLAVADSSEFKNASQQYRMFIIDKLIEADRISNPLTYKDKSYYYSLYLNM